MKARFALIALFIAIPAQAQYYNGYNVQADMLARQQAQIQAQQDAQQQLAYQRQQLQEMQAQTNLMRQQQTRQLYGNPYQPRPVFKPF